MSQLLISTLIMSAVSATDPVNNATRITWITWEEAVELNQKQPKKIFVDVYTEWWGWCKKMDASTFEDARVIEYMNEHFYAVKLDAEMKREIIFRDQQFKWVDAGRRGIHTLAYSLLEGKMSYPSFVTLNENFDRIAVGPGF